MDNKLLKRRSEILRQSGIFGVILGLLTTLVIAALSMLSLISSAIFIILVPFVILPFFFASQIAHLYVLNDGKLTLKAFFTFFGKYYLSNNRTTYRPLNSFFKSLLFLLGGSVVGIIIASIVVTSIDREAFINIVATIQDILLNVEEYSEMTYQEIFGEYYYLIVLFALISSIPPVILGVGAFCYFITFNGIHVFSHIEMKNMSPFIIRRAMGMFNREKGREVLKDFWSLNFPMFILYLLFAVGGTLLCYFKFSEDSEIISSLAVTFGLFGLGLYLPVYYASTEAIHEKYHLSYSLCLLTAQKEAFMEARGRIDLSEEEIKNIEASIEEAEAKIKQMIEEENNNGTDSN